MKFWEWVKQSLSDQIIPIFFRRFRANGFSVREEDDAKTNAARSAAKDRRMRLDDK